MRTLVYVDRQLAIAMAVKLIGLQISEERSTGGGGSFNWLIQAYVSHDASTGITTDIRELLPEEVMYELYDAISDEYKFEKVSDCVTAMAESGDKRLLPGRPISVQGKLMLPDMKLSRYDPFNPPDIEVKTFNFHGEKCFTGKLHGDDFILPIYFDEGAEAQVAFCHQQPVEVTGIVRWSPSYSPQGSRALNLVIRTAALWLN